MIRIAALLAVLPCACSAPPEPAAETASALNGQSVPPPGGWGNGPQICSGTWNPMAQLWPAHGFCVWQPDPGAPGYPWNVGPCLGPAPSVPGTIWIYSGENYTGSCAQVANAFNTTPYQFDSDLVQYNGWLSIWHQNLTKHAVWIKSIRWAPTTRVQLCDGPFSATSGPPNVLCAPPSIAVGGDSGAQGLNIPNLILSNGAYYIPAAIQLSMVP